VFISVVSFLDCACGRAESASKSAVERLPTVSVFAAGETASDRAGAVSVFAVGETASDRAEAVSVFAIGETASDRAEAVSVFAVGETASDRAEAVSVFAVGPEPSHFLSALRSGLRRLSLSFASFVWGERVHRLLPPSAATCRKRQLSPRVHVPRENSRQV
jgi:hypothetical protein